MLQRMNVPCDLDAPPCSFPSMLPLLLKDGLLLPYIVTSLGFLFFSLHLLSVLDCSTTDHLRLGPLCGRLGACLPGSTFPLLVRWGVGVAPSRGQACSIWAWFLTQVNPDIYKDKLV